MAINIKPAVETVADKKVAVECAPSGHRHNRSTTNTTPAQPTLHPPSTYLPQSKVGFGTTNAKNDNIRALAHCFIQATSVVIAKTARTVERVFFAA